LENLEEEENEPAIAMWWERESEKIWDERRGGEKNGYGERKKMKLKLKLR